MEGKELYKKYAGRKASYFGEKETTIGTVVGYDEENLIMAVEEGPEGWGLDYPKGRDLSWVFVKTHEFIEDSWKDHKKGFLYIDEKNVCPE